MFLTGKKQAQLRKQWLGDIDYAANRHAISQRQEIFFCERNLTADNHALFERINALEKRLKLLEDDSPFIYKELNRALQLQNELKVLFQTHMNEKARDAPGRTCDTPAS